MNLPLEFYVSQIFNEKLRSTCQVLLNSERFNLWPASFQFHHAYESGIRVHTEEVGVFAEQMRRGTSADADILKTAVVWHDAMKIWEYDTKVVPMGSIPGERCLFWKTEGGKDHYWVRSHVGYDRLVGHISGGALEFQIEARKFEVLDSDIQRVAHCLLSHHGRREWGSPVEPQTVEALILHQADMLSAKFGPTKDAR